MHGVINLLKPPGMTSHDAVAFVRRTTGIKRVGHTGTLDPAAAGVLPICIGQATRLVEYLQAGTKEYTAEITFGHETDTLDATGNIVAQADANHVTLETLRAALDPFRGPIQQTPPLYSAIKQGGKKLYELARGGASEAEVEIASREVVIHRLFVTRFAEGSTTSPPRAMLHLECGGGAYIRSLVRDIGRALGCFATMTFLVRTRSGSFCLDEAHTVEEIADDATAALVPIREALTWCVHNHAVIVDDKTVENLARGRTAVFINKDLETPKRSHEAKATLVLFMNSASTVAALARLAPSSAEHTYQPEKVFHLNAPID